jgi:hypothetical protein
MYQCNVGALFERIAVDIAGPFPKSDRGNQYLLIAMGYCTKWPEVYPIPNQEASTVADALVTNFSCRFGVPRELHSDQDRNFESQLMQEVLERLRISRTGTTPSSTVGQHGGGASAEGGFDAPEGLGREATNLPPGLSGNDTRSLAL